MVPRGSLPRHPTLARAWSRPQGSLARCRGPHGPTTVTRDDCGGRRRNTQTGTWEGSRYGSSRPSMTIAPRRDALVRPAKGRASRKPVLASGDGWVERTTTCRWSSISVAFAFAGTPLSRLATGASRAAIAATMRRPCTPLRVLLLAGVPLERAGLMVAVEPVSGPVARLRIWEMERIGSSVRHPDTGATGGPTRSTLVTALLARCVVEDACEIAGQQGRRTSRHAIRLTPNLSNDACRIAAWSPVASSRRNRT